MSTTQCIVNWDTWSPCNAVCDNSNRTRVSATGTQTRTYKINSGSPITIEVPCTKLCPVDCAGGYSNWNDCNATCSNNQKYAKGLRKRTYSVTRSNFNGGEACDGSQLAEDCDKMCPVNCVGKWSLWSGCVSNGNCDGKTPFINGKNTREYKISTFSSNGGNSCEVEDGTIETEDCTKECKVDSMFFWLTIGISSLVILILLFLVYNYYRKKAAKAAKAAAVALVPAGTGRRKNAGVGTSVSSTS
jgi:hypothetical protein